MPLVTYEDCHVIVDPETGADIRWSGCKDAALYELKGILDTARFLADAECEWIFDQPVLHDDCPIEILNPPTTVDSSSGLQLQSGRLYFGPECYVRVTTESIEFRWSSCPADVILALNERIALAAGQFSELCALALDNSVYTIHRKCPEFRYEPFSPFGP